MCQRRSCFGRLLKLVPLSLGNRYYERRARTRYAEFGKYDACPVPPPEVRRRLLSGELGTPRQLRAELGFVVAADPDDRLLDPALGAGAG